MNDLTLKCDEKNLNCPLLHAYCFVVHRCKSNKIIIPLRSFKTFCDVSFTKKVLKMK